MCHYSIGPLYNFFSKFLQGYFGLCHVSEIFYYLSTVHVSEVGGHGQLFRNPNSPQQFTFSDQKPQKKLKKMMNIIWTPWTCKNPASFSHQNRTILFFSHSDSNKNTQTARNLAHTYTNGSERTKKKEEEASLKFSGPLLSPFSKPKQEVAFSFRFPSFFCSKFPYL